MIEYLTVYVIWAKTPLTWDYKNHKPLGFKHRLAAISVLNQTRRNYRRMGIKFKNKLTVPITSHSINNPCLTIK